MLLDADAFQQFVIVRNQRKAPPGNVVLSNLTLHRFSRARRQLHRAEPLDHLVNAPRVDGRLLPALQEFGRGDLAVDVVNEGRY